MGTIYIFTFPNGKQYVGQTTNLKQRYSKHKAPCSRLSPLGNAIQKYGWNNIQKQEMSCSEKYLDWIETEWITFLNCLAPRGYNLDSGGKGNKHLSEITKQKISNSLKGHRGRQTSKETRKKISNSLKGKKHSEETRLKISESNKGKHFFSKETRKRISDHEKETKKNLKEKKYG